MDCILSGICCYVIRRLQTRGFVLTHLAENCVCGKRDNGEEGSLQVRERLNNREQAERQPIEDRGCEIWANISKGMMQNRQFCGKTRNW